MKLAHIAIAAAALTAGAFALGAKNAADAQASSQGVVVLDMARLRSQALAFQDMDKKLRTVAEQQGATFKTSIEGEVKAVEASARALRPSLQGKTAQEIAANPQLKTQVDQQVAREQAIQKKDQIMQLSLQKTGQCAEAAVARQLDPVIEQIMTQYNASIVLSREVVAKARPTVDVTQEAINRFNAAVKTATVTWSPYVEGASNQSCS